MPLSTLATPFIGVLGVLCEMKAAEGMLPDLDKHTGHTHTYETTRHGPEGCLFFCPYFAVKQIMGSHSL